MFDIVGDIHGHAEPLKKLLSKMGYVQKNGSYSHPERKILFVGDYIDRGPDIRETLHVVRAMVESNNAIALMGNHEYNALCFHFKNSGGGHLRSHSIKNIIQHYETLRQFKNRDKEYEQFLDWFLTLPLFYETDEFRVVHACWDHLNIAYLKERLMNHCLTDSLIYESVNPESAMHKAVEETLKGKELALPAGISFFDPDGMERRETRIKWWEDPFKHTYRTLSIEAKSHIPDIPVISDGINHLKYYSESEKTVFFGHYWFSGIPSFLRPNICCLDYSIAKNGKLVAYRYSAEEMKGDTEFFIVE